MKKTISINLNKQNFQIEEEAYEKLASYLESIKKHCGAGADAAEVIDDIENSLAEKLKLSLNEYKEIVTLEDIENLIKVMGTVEDFDREIGSFDNESKDEKENENAEKTKRKLYRDSDNAIIGGVAAGLGNYFDVDPVLFRIIFIALMFAGGSGFPIYILLWIAMPEARTAYQKLEMQGRAPTLAAFKNLAKAGKDLQENWKKRWERRSTLNKIMSVPMEIIRGIFKAIKKVWLALWPIIRVSFGLFLSIFSFVILGITGIVSLIFLLYANSNYQISFVPISELAAIVPYKIIIISGFLSVAIPLFLNLIGGISIIKKKSIINLTTSLILLGSWMVVGICFFAFSLRYFPEVENKFSNNPLTEYIEKDLDLNGVEEISVDGNLIYVYINSSTSTPASLEGRQVDLNNIDIKREGNSLFIKEKEILKNNDICLDCNLHTVKVNVASSSVFKIKTQNGAEIIEENEILIRIDQEEY